MEASGAGLATGDGGDAAQQQGSQADGTESQQPAEPTIADTHALLQQFGTDIEQMREHLATEPWAPQAPAEQQQQQATPPANELDFSFLDETAPQYQGPEAAMQQLGQLIRGEAEKVAQQQLAPVQQELQQEKQERGYEDLANRYPQLQDSKVAKELLDLTHQVVEQEGFPPDLAFHPGFVEKIYLASRAQAQNQDGGTAAAATLESAGGASPGGAGQSGSQQVTGAEFAKSIAPQRLGLFTGG